MLSLGVDSPKQIFAFFDLDHTLLPFDTQTMFCDFVLKRERTRTWRHLFFVPVAILKGLRLVKTVTAKRAFMSYLGGIKMAKVHVYAQEFAQTMVRPWLFPEMLKIIEEHRNAGHTLILNTASPDFYAHEIAKVLGIDYCIATRMEKPETLPFWPKVMDVNNKHEAKIVAMKRDLPFVAAATAEQLSESWAYSDSKADLPLLEFAGKGVLVHPSAFLEAIGKERGWQVLHPKLPYKNKLGDGWASLKQILGVF